MGSGMGYECTRSTKIHNSYRTERSCWNRFIYSPQYHNVNISVVKKHNITPMLISLYSHHYYE